MNVKHQVYVLLTVGIVLFFTLLSIRIPTPTGMAVIEDYTNHDRTDDTYAEVLHDTIREFFVVDNIAFPMHACTEVAKNMYEDITYRTMDVENGFASSGQHRIASINFVTDRLRRYGTVDMVNSRELLQDYDADAVMSFSVESIVAVPKEDRTNFFSMDLFGDIQDYTFYVQKGRYSTPSLDCTFIRYNGNVACDCDTHPIRGIEVAGITGYAPDKDYYQEVIDELQQIRQQR